MFLNACATKDLLLSIDPDRLAQRQERMELQRRRMQEAVNASAAEHAEKMKEVRVASLQNHF